MQHIGNGRFRPNADFRRGAGITAFADGSDSMSWELIGILAFIVVLFVYAIRQLPRAIKDLKKVLGE